MPVLVTLMAVVQVMRAKVLCILLWQLHAGGVACVMNVTLDGAEGVGRGCAAVVLGMELLRGAIGRGEVR